MELINESAYDGAKYSKTEDAGSAAAEKESAAAEKEEPVATSDEKPFARRKWISLRK